MLILPSDPDLGATGVAACVAAGDIAAVIAPVGEGSAETARLRTLCAPVQAAGVAFLLDGRADLVAAVAADGAHLSGLATLRNALPALKPNSIAGAGGLPSRHDAMEAGEAGADYVLFGGEGAAFPQTEEMISWWAEVFEVPCVGVAGDAEEALALAHAGADFIALAGPWISSEDGPRIIADIDARLAATDLVA